MKKVCEHKSLFKRILFLTNFTTIVSVLIMSIVMILVFGQVFNLVENSLSEYYVEEIEEIIIRSTHEKDGLIEIKNQNILIRNINKLHQTVPYLMIKIVINDQVVYREFGDLYLPNVFIMDIHDKPKGDIIKEIPHNYSFRELDNVQGEIYGVISVGIDAKLKGILLCLLILFITPVALLLMVIMGFFAKTLTKPMLNPLNELTKQLNHLADEKFDTMAPSLQVNEKRLKEVYELSLATNRLLDKMIDYNEVITQSEKMASVGQLTAAITHEINTPLGAINSNINMIKLLTESMPVDMNSNQEIHDIKEQIVDATTLSEEACLRINKIIRSLKLYTRIDQTNFMPANINESVKSVVVLTTNLHKNKIKIHTCYGDIPEVSCHIGLINQVFMNIFINAIQSIENKGEINITTSSDDINVYVSIKDTGCGISTKNIYNIFQYGFTTKQPGSGSGIGLALSNNIIKKHNGSITVDSTEDEGSTFTVIIPIVQKI